MSDIVYTDDNGYEWQVTTRAPFRMSPATVANSAAGPTLRFSRPTRWAEVDGYRRIADAAPADLTDDQMDELLQSANRSWSEYVYCIHCEFGYPAASLGVAPGDDRPGVECATDGCDGGYIDRVDWEDALAGHDWPESPEAGVHYDINQ